MNKSPKPMLSMERSKAFADGVMAVVITLLVLGLEVPEDHKFDEKGLVAFLWKIFYMAHPYVGSFAVIATYWLQHTVIFHYIERGSRKFIWLNLVFLLLVSPMPFLTALRVAYPQVPIVVALFGGMQLACGLTLLTIWRFAASGHWVNSSNIDPVTNRSMSIRILLGQVIIVAALLAGFVYDGLTSVIFLFGPMLYISHRQVDSHWMLEDGGGARPSES